VQQRVLTYRMETLHFERLGNGWNFIFGARGSRSGLTRSQVEAAMPCFGKAMADVQVVSPIQSVQMDAAQAPAVRHPEVAATETQVRSLMQRVAALAGQMAPTTICLILLVYLLPSIIGLIRGPGGLGLLIALNVLLGWTVIGWIAAMVMACGARAEELDGGTMPRPGRLRRRPERVPLNVIGAPLGRSLRSVSTMRSAVSRTDPDPNPEEQFLPYRQPVLPAMTEGQRRTFAESQQRRAEASQAPRRVLLPSDAVAKHDRGMGIGYASDVPSRDADHIEIEWTEHYLPRRTCRIEVASGSRQVTLYDIQLSQRGIDHSGREYLGGYVDKRFVVIPKDKVLHMRDSAA